MKKLNYIGYTLACLAYVVVGAPGFFLGALLGPAWCGFRAGLELAERLEDEVGRRQRERKKREAAG